MFRVFRHFGAVRLLGVAAVLLGSGAWTAQAGAAATSHLYWANLFSASIGRATVNGTGATENFIKGASQPTGVAVGGYIFWANSGTNTIGRANLNHTHARPKFIKGANAPWGVAVGGQYVYWVNSGNGTIGRAKVDGKDVKQSIIPGADAGDGGVAVNGQYIYWADNSNGLERANLNGTDPKLFIKGADLPEGVAINGQYIFWANAGNDTIGRANLDGSDPKQNLITLCTGCLPPSEAAPHGIAVDGAYIYFSLGLGTSNGIDRANLDGTGLKQDFISPNQAPSADGVAATGTPDAVVTPAKLTGYDPRPVGTTSPPQTATVTNVGTGALAVTKAFITGSAPSDFLISQDTCLRASVQPGSSCKIAVRFKPTVKGPRTAKLKLLSNNPSPLTVPLAGGFPWKLSFTSYPQNSTDVPTEVVAVTNNVLVGSKHYLNVDVNGSGSTTYHFSTACKGGRTCLVSLSMGTFTVTADVGPKDAQPFGKNTIVSDKTTLSVTRKIVPPGCPPNCM